jgi:4-diphosphocytidyl-2-C-methyl-D-erythritol kinase
MQMPAPFAFMRLERASPCKINLLLNILGRRPDGFHELETLMQPVPVHDDLVLEKSASGITLTCSDPHLPADGSNLVHRAVAGFLAAAAIRAGVRIHLEKRLPLAAGLGGGSSNAAATLLALNELYGQPLSPSQLHAIAAALGSDVPFFLQPHPALATGRGENVRPLEPFTVLKDAWVLLIHPGFGISTAWAYQQLARFPCGLHGEPGRGERLVAAWSSGDLIGGLTQLYNSLEAPALEKYPILALYQEHLRAAGALATLMSGSGSTTFALAANRQAAERLREAFFARFGSTAWTAIAPLSPA